MEGPTSRRQKDHQRGQATRQHQVPKPVARSISNNETGGPFERTSSLEEPSLITTTRLKIKTVYASCNATTVPLSLYL
jgi:hypothetical protein